MGRSHYGRSSWVIGVALIAALTLATGDIVVGRADGRMAGTTAAYGVTTATAVAAGSVGIASWTYWVASGQVRIIADVVNNTSVRQAVTAKATLYNASNAVIGTLSTSPFEDALAAGNHSPVDFNPTSTPAGFDHVNVSIASTAPWTSGPIPGVLSIRPAAEFTDGYGLHYTLALTNHTASTVIWFESVALYDSGGRMINSEWAGYDSIPPHSTVEWPVTFNDHYATATHVQFQARAGSYDSTVPNVATSWDNYFDDIGSSSFRTDILWMADAGVTAGCGSGLYCPTADVSRGQMAAFLARALSLPSTATDYFTDDNGTLFEGDINALAAAGITKGCTATTFCPTADVTRGQMAAFLVRALGLPGTTTDYFTDDNGTTFESDINRLAAAGITGGCTATTFCPADNVTRGQMAAFLHRALG